MSALEPPEHGMGCDAVKQLQGVLAQRQEVVADLRSLAHQDGAGAKQRASSLYAVLMHLDAEVERLLMEIERLAGPPAGPRIDGQI